MHLRSLTLKGFKSFPDRTRLEFSPGVSVVVGPNGSGKSNIADAVMWALGQGLGEHFTGDVRDARAAVFAAIQEAMLVGMGRVSQPA